MKRGLIAIALLAGMTFGAVAESLLVKTGNVTYSFPADRAGEMLYSGGVSLTILGKEFSLEQVSEMCVDDAVVEPQTVSVTYTGETAQVLVDGRIARYLTVSVNGAHVSVVQNSSVTEEITYSLSGSSDNGSFLTSGSYKTSIDLCGLTLTNPSGAAIEIENGKRINLRVKDGTVNSLTDGANGDQKGCVRCKGHLEIKGSGTLNVKGNTAHAFHVKEYVTLKNATVNITGAVKDGLNCNQYFTMESGILNIEGVGDDGIQVSFKDEEATREPDDTATLTIKGGTVKSVCTATSGEAIKSDAYIVIDGGDVTATAIDDAINAAKDININGGNIYARSTSNDGIDANGNLYFAGGNTIAIGGGAPEGGIDANEEGGYSVYFRGGTLLALGGRNSTPSASTSIQPYVSGNVSVSAGTVVELKRGSDVLASFTIPSDYSASSSSAGGRPGGGFGPGGNGGPGGNSTSALITCSGLTSGNSYTLTCGSSSTTVSARTTGSSGGGRGF